MAYVALSRQVRHDIDYVVRTMHAKELNALTCPPELGPLISSGLIMDKLWARYAHLRETTPAEWMRQVDTVTIEVLDSEGTRVNRSYVHGKFMIPPNSSSHIELTVQDVPQAALHAEYHQQRREVIKRWQGIQTSISAFLDSCKSLNEALKLMPELAHYVPPRYIDKVNEKVERPKRDKAEVQNAAAEVDRDALIAGVIAARLSGDLT